MKLVVGNKNYSSWSMRAWLTLKQLGIAFEEVELSFRDPDFAGTARRFSPAAKVPVLIDGELVVWDSLAIVEHVAERFPGKGAWPQDAAARATARSLCAEMHAGFRALREHMPMNCNAHLPGLGWNLRVQKDIDRIVLAWTDARARFGQGGPFLFGGFSIADAYFAPVTRRFVTYAVALPDVAARYVDTIAELPAMKEWLAAAARAEFVAFEEPYRAAP